LFLKEKSTLTNIYMFVSSGIFKHSDSGGPVFEERDGTPEGDLLMAVISGGAQG
jgi:hypothetical protein